MDTSVRSEIVESELIFSFVIEGQSFERWIEESDGRSRRSGRLTLRIETIYKGSSAQQADDPFVVQIEQRANPDGGVKGYYGLWSNAPTATGTRLIAFAEGAGSTMSETLSDDHCQRLARSGGIEDGVRLAMSLETGNASGPEILTQAGAAKGQTGAVFARFVWVRTHDWVAASLDAFNQLMMIAEDPETRLESRESYLIAAYEDATLTEGFFAEHEVRLARAMFRTALDPTVGELRTHLLGTYLPNLVGVETAERLTRHAVFAGEPLLLERVRDEVQRAPDAFAESLRSWLVGGGT